MAKNPLTRRQFIHVGTGALAATTVAGNLLQPHLLSAGARPVPPSDTVRFASIGTGIRGCELLKASLQIPGVECVAVCHRRTSPTSTSAPPCGTRHERRL
jgi:hypothetical protein